MANTLARGPSPCGRESLRNLTVADAAQRLRGEGLRLVVGGERRVVGMPAGLVIDQSPHPGSTTMRENEVRVVLSGTP